MSKKRVRGRRIDVTFRPTGVYGMGVAELQPTTDPSDWNDPQATSWDEPQPINWDEPQETQPFTPQEPQPSTPQETQPSTPQEPQPSTPQEPQPSTPQEPQPSTPQEPQPSTPQEPQPSTPQEPQPSTSTADEPEEDIDWGQNYVTKDKDILRVIHQMAREKREREEEFASTQIRLDEEPRIVKHLERMPVIPKSCLKTPEWVKPAKMSAVEEFRRNCIRDCEIFIPTKGGFPSMKTLNSQRQRFVNLLRNSIDKAVREDYHRRSYNVLTPPVPTATIPLGPTACHEVNQKMINQNSQYNYSSTGCFTNTRSRFVFLNIQLEPETNSEELVKDVENDLGVTEVLNTAFDFSFPGVPYSIQMKYGEEVKLIKKEDDSRFAVVVEDLASCYCSDLNEHFSEKFEQNVKVREMSNIELKEFCRRNSGYDEKVLRSQGYLVMFESLESKQQAKCKDELMACGFTIDGTIDYTNSFTTVSLEVIYNHKRVPSQYARVVIRNPLELGFAEEVFSAHQVWCKYANEKSQFVPEAKYRKGNNALYIYDFPKWVNTQEYLEWFVHRILDANGIATKHIQFMRRSDRNNSRFDNYFDNNGYSKEYTPADILDRRLVWTCSDSFRWNQNKVVLEAEHSTDKIAKSTDYWTIETLPPLDYRGFEQRLIARFSDKNYQMGLFAAENFVEGCDAGSRYIVFNKYQRISPRVIPRIRKMFPISKNVRISFDSEIRALDEELKKQTLEYQELESELSSPYADLVSLQIVEHYPIDESDGFIGIEGWKENYVRTAVAQLESLLEPVCLNCADEGCEELLYGFGEVYAKKILSNLGKTVVADFDRFNRKIYLYGSGARTAIDEMKKYKMRKPMLQISAEIMFNGSYLNKDLINFLSVEDVHQIAYSLNARCRVNDASVEFEGFLTAFEAFQAIFNQSNNLLFTRQTAGLPDSLRWQSCPVCMDKLDFDFYRLEACGHSYCTNCINNLIRCAIDDRKIPHKCLYEGCDKFIAPIDFKHIILGGDDRVKALDSVKLKKLCKQSIVSVLLGSEGEVKVCVTPDCPAILISDKSSDPNGKTTEECRNCERKYCKKCLGAPHENQTCEQYKILRENSDLSLKAFEKENAGKVRRCPKPTCQAVIMKSEGCNHMECTYCKTHFCWFCGFSANTDSEIYGHMRETHGSFMEGPRGFLDDDEDALVRNLRRNFRREIGLDEVPLEYRGF